MTTVQFVMSSAKPRNSHEDEIIFERLRKSLTRAIRTLILEIIGNYHRVKVLLTGVWTWYLYYIFVYKSSLQNMLQQFKQLADVWKGEVTYEEPFIDAIKNQILFKLQRRKELKFTKCICYSHCSRRYLELQARRAEELSSWLLAKGVEVSFDDSELWDNGDLLDVILRTVLDGDDSDRRKPLENSNKAQKWSLLINIIKSKFPGLIQSKLLLHCLTSSKPTPLHHIVEILFRIKHARRKLMKASFAGFVTRALNFLDSYVQPYCHLSGPGTVYAKLNSRNEVVLKTQFQCPPFRVEIEDDKGEVWRESSCQAKSSTSQDVSYADSENFSSAINTVPPIEIVRVSKSHFRIFYFVRHNGAYKISVKPGISASGHVYGSPFCIQAETVTYWRQNSKRKMELSKKLPIETGSKPEKVLENNGRVESTIHRPAEPSENDKTKTMLNEKLSTAVKVSDVSDTTHKSTISFRPYLGLRKMTKAILHHIGSGLNNASRRMLSSMSMRGKTEKSNTESQRRRRKTLATAYANGKMSMRHSVETNDLNVPSSRKLRIRKVIIHRYLNDPMPSLEEYLFGEGGFNLDETDTTCDANHNKRWKHISALLRLKMKMMNQNESYSSRRRSSPTKVSSESGRKRGVRLQRYSLNRSSPRNGNSPRKRRLSNDSSSSYENDYDETGGENDAGNIVLFQDSRNLGHCDANGVQHMTNHTTRFKHIFDNQKGAADILLQTSTERSSLPSFTYPRPRFSRTADKSCPKNSSSEHYTSDNCREAASMGLSRENKLCPGEKFVIKEMAEAANSTQSKMNVDFVTYARHLVDNAIHSAVQQLKESCKDLSKN